MNKTERVFQAKVQSRQKMTSKSQRLARVMDRGRLQVRLGLEHRQLLCSQGRDGARIIGSHLPGPLRLTSIDINMGWTLQPEQRAGV